MKSIIGFALLAAAGAAALGGVAGGAGAVETATPQQGLAVAEARCAVCHAVTREEEYSPNMLAPTFPEVANTPGMTATAISAWLRGAHDTMPALMLSSDEMAAITAYILSLKGAE